MPRVSAAIFPLHSSYEVRLHYNQDRGLWLVLVKELKSGLELEFHSFEAFSRFLERQTKPKGLR
jgi:hypothetical protein